MSRVFEVTLPKTASEFLSDAKKSARSNGVHLIGDEFSGRFTGKGIEGAYRIEGNKLAISIVKKPLIMPWPLIESAVRNYFI